MRIQYRFPRTAPVLRIGALATIHKDHLDMDEVERRFRIPNPVYWDKKKFGEEPPPDMPAYIHLFAHDADTSLVRLARNIPPPLLEPEKVRVVRLRGSEPLRGIDHKIKLRDTIQEEAAQALMDGPGTDKILSLTCGTGKTVTSLYAAAEGKRMPVLVVVDTEDLLDQWRKKAAEFYGLPLEAIGHIQQDTEHWKGCAITIALVQTLVRRTYSEEFYRYFNLVIYDEVHIFGASTFGKSAPMFRGERWGLSATVDRRDRMERAFKAHLGEVTYRDTTQTLTADTIFIETGIHHNLRGLPHPMNRGYNIAMISRLSKSDARNDILHWFIEKQWKAGREVIMLGDRVEQLELLYKRSTCPSKGLMLGKANSKGKAEKALRKEALKHQVVFATDKLAMKGLDKPLLSVLVVPFPFADPTRLQQSWGRVLRDVPGKPSPLCAVFVDESVSAMENLERKMKVNMQRLKYPFRNVSRAQALEKPKTPSVPPPPSPAITAAA